MSKQIDERVVRMRFDNQHFENNVKTTISTLDKLKQNLKFKQSSQSLKDLGKTADNVKGNFKELEYNACQAGFSFRDVWLKVSNVFEYQVAGRIIQAGKRMISALTIDPIKTGFQEYETQIGAVQTILANTSSKGTTLQDVNSALDTLNTYADKTIYNFTEMTRNIGTFTAAGIDLDKSVSSIQGIANLAAVSGSTSQQASTAMYQLSQALSAGTVKLMDWNSVVNAGMGGQVFQDALKRTATVMGTNVDALIKKNGSFRESLQEGWITADVLTKTLEQFTMAAEEGTEEWERYKKSLMDDGYTEAQAIEILKMANTATNAATKVKTFTQLWDTLKESAQSGWTSTWEIIVGDFEEAKDFLTHISDTIGPMISAAADARNELLAGGLSSGWKQLLSAGIADENGFIETVKEVAKTHNGSIDEMIEKEKGFSAALADGLKKGTISSDMLTESVTKMADKMSNMSSEELAAAGYTAEHVSQIKNLSKGLKDGSISMDEFAKKIMRPSGRENLIQALQNAFDGLMSIIKPIKEAFSEIFPAATSEQLYTLTERIKELSAKLIISEDTAKALKSTFKGVFSIIKLGADLIMGFVKGAANLLGAILPVGDGLLATTGSIGDFVSGVCEAVSELNIFENVFSVLSNIVSPVADAIGSAFTGIANGIDNMGGFIGILKAVANAISWLFDEIIKLTNGLTKGEGFQPLMDLVNGGLLAGVLVGIKKFMKSLTDITSDGFGFFKGINEILGGVSDALGAFTNSIKAGTLKKIAISIGILAAALLVLSLIKPDKMAASLGAITTLFIELFASMAVFEKIMGGSGFKSMGKVTRAMLKLSKAVLILAIALKIISTIPWQQMLVGLGGIAASMGILIGAVKLLPEKDLNSTAKAIKKLSTSLLILAVALKIMGSMSWGEMAVGLVTMVGGLAALIGASYLLPKDLGGKALGMIALAAAMLILSSALKIMGTMSWEEIGRGLTVLAGSLIIIAGAMHIIPSALPGALALLIISAALVVLSGALKIMGTMSWDAIAKGLTVLAGSLIIIAGAMYIMTGSLLGAAALLVIAAALAVLAPVLLALGSMSWESIAKGLLTLAGAFAVIGLAGLLLTPLVPSLLGLGAAIALLGAGCALVGAGILAFSAGLAALAVSGTAGAAALVGIIRTILELIPSLCPALGAAIVSLVTTITQTLIICIPQILACLSVMVTSLLEFLISAIPQFVDAGMKIIIGILQGIANSIGGVIQAATDIIVNFITGIGEGLPRIVDAGIKMIISFINGLADSIRENTPLMIDAVNNLMDAIIDAIKAWFKNFTSRGKDMVTNLTSGIKSKFASFKSVAKDMMDGFIKGIGEKFGAIKDKAVNAVKGAVDAVKKFLGINSPSKLFATFGRYTDEGFIIGLQKYSKDVYNAGAGIGKAVNDGIRNALEINSPAKVTMEDGKYVVQGIAEGIKKDMSAEEAAAQKAKNIENAFKTEFDKWDISEKTLDLESKLWGANNPEATDVETAAKELELISNKIPIYTEKLALAQGKYQVTLDTFGDQATETKEAYNEWLQAQIDLAELNNKYKTTNESMLDAQHAAIEKQGKAQQEYRRILREEKDTIERLTKTFGWAKAEAWAREASGLNEAVNITPSVNITDPVASSTGANYAQSVTAGLQVEAPGVTTALESFNNTCVKTITSRQEDWHDAGVYVVEGFATGIKDGKSQAVNAAAEMAAAAVAAAQSILGIASPSKVFYGVGSFSGLGFVNALRDYKDKSYDAGSEMAESAKSGLGDVMSKVKDFIESDMDTAPRIRPVLDLSEIQNGASQLNGMLSGRRTVALAGAASMSIDSYTSANRHSTENTKIVDAIGELRSDFGALTNAIGTMHIRMDSGAVVGELVRKIDSSLGRIADQRRRAN